MKWWGTPEILAAEWDGRMKKRRRQRTTERKQKRRRRRRARQTMAGTSGRTV